MGIYDRDYYQEEPPRGFQGSGPKTVVMKIVVLTMAVYVIDLLAGGQINAFTRLEFAFYRQPWKIYELLSHGFAHADVWHVGFNMFLLWMFGRDVEPRLGGREFLTFYLTSLCFAGLVWLGWTNLTLLSTEAGREFLQHAPMDRITAEGASGAVTAVFILFVLYYPRQTILFWAIPVRAWVLGAIWIGMDLIRGITGMDPNTAWEAHLGGAAFAFLYLKSGIRLSRFVPSGIRLPQSRPQLRIHDPEADEDSLAREADAILDKLHREGEDSLTRRERRILEKYSRSVRDRRDR